MIDLMRKTRTWNAAHLGRGLALCVAVLAFAAAENAEAQQVKIGVFDAQRVSAETAAGAKIQARLSALQNTRRTEIEAMAKALQEKQDSFVATAASLSEEKRKVLGFEIQRAENELEARRKTVTQELTLEVEAAQAEWQQSMLAAVRRYGKENGYTMILPKEIVIYHDASVDVTDELIALVDQSSAGTGTQ